MGELNKDNLVDSMLLLESLNDGFYVVDTDRHILYWNAAAERITGWKKEDILGKTCADDVLSHVDKDGHQLCGEEHCPLHRAMVTDQGSEVPIIVFAKSKSGKRVPMRVSVAPIRNAEGKVIGGVEDFRDVTSEYRDIDMARRFQSAILHKKGIKDERISFTSYYLSCDIVSGDYYAFSRIDENKSAFILADVAGHGLSAALYTVYLNSFWGKNLNSLMNPTKVARAINTELEALDMEDMKFATAILGLMDLENMKLSITFAGGPEPILFRGDGRVEILKGSGMPLGSFAEAKYDEITVDVKPGDSLLAFSDGVSEISGQKGNLLEVEGLVEILKEVGYPKSGDFDMIEEKLLKFSDRIQFKDDITFLEMRLL